MSPDTKHVFCKGQRLTPELGDTETPLEPIRKCECKTEDLAM